MIVFPVAHFCRIAGVGKYYLKSFFDTHAIRRYFNQFSLLIEYLPLAISVFLIIEPFGKQMALFIESLMTAITSRSDVNVAYAQHTVWVEILKGINFKVILKRAFVDFSAIFIGSHPMALFTTLFVYLILCATPFRGCQKANA